MKIWKWLTGNVEEIMVTFMIFTATVAFVAVAWRVNADLQARDGEEFDRFIVVPANGTVILVPQYKAKAPSHAISDK